MGYIIRIHRIRVDGRQNRNEKFPIQKYPDTCGRGPRWIENFFFLIFQTKLSMKFLGAT